MTVPRHTQEVRSSLHDWRVAAVPRSGITAGVRRHETPFVGRAALLQQFDEILVHAQRSRHQVVLLTGEGGIGKTRLLRAFAARGVLLGLDVTWTDDLSAGRPPQVPPATDPSDASPGGLAMVPVPYHYDPAASARLAMVDLNARLDSLDEVTGTILDGEPSLPTVMFLAMPSAIGPSVIPVHRLLAAFARRRILHEISIPPMDDAELFELASHILGGPPHARLHQTISSLSEGNPLLAEEVAWDLHRIGLVGNQNGVPYLVSDVPEQYVPTGIAAALGVELDAIDPDMVQTLSAAAVLGPAVDFEVIAAALHQPDEQILRHLEAGIAHGILREAPDPSTDFVFSHELVRRTLYRRLSQIRRRSVHQAVAEALERVNDHAHRPGQSATLAYHFTRGRDPGRALDYVLRAQERAEDARSWDEAIRYCREGLELARQAGHARVVLQIDLLERLGALYFGRAETFATGACWREALHLCEQVGTATRRAALTARLAALGASWCSMAEAEAALRAALEPADDHGSKRAADAVTWLFDAYHELGLAYQRLGRIPDAVVHLRRACDMAVLEDWPRSALARASLASALISAGEPAEAAALLRSALMSLDATKTHQLVGTREVNHLRDPRRIRCLALGNLVRALTNLGQLDEAAQLAHTVIDAEREFGMLGGQGQRAMAQVELARGRPERAMAALAARMRQSAAGSLSAHRVVDLLLLAQAYLDRGDAALAFETANDGINLSERTGALEHLAGLHVVTARALLARGEIEAARAAASAAHQMIDSTGAEVHRPSLLATEAAWRAASSVRRQGPVGTPRTGSRDRTISSDRAGAGTLTAREHEVLALMADGRTNRQIADVLILSEKTVKRHLSNMFAKFGVGTRAAAVRCAFEYGILRRSLS